MKAIFSGPLVFSTAATVPPSGRSAARAGSPPASAVAAVSARIVLRVKVMALSLLCIRSVLASPADAVEADRDDDDEPLRHHLPVGREAEEHEGVRQERHQQRPEHHPGIEPRPPESAVPPRMTAAITSSS